MRSMVTEFTIPIGVLFVLTVLISLLDADLRLAKLFYSAGQGWLWKDDQPWIWLYQYGTVAPIALAVFGFFMASYSYFTKRFVPWRKAFVFLAVALILGPGLVVNAVFKDHWGRPRPAELEMFGGTKNYLPVWQRGTAGQDKSFPCGHASAGYFLFTPFFFLRKKYPKWAWSFLWIGILYGTVMGIGRMAQGGHFATDVIWAGGLVYLTGLTLGYLFRFDDADGAKISS